MKHILKYYPPYMVRVGIWILIMLPVTSFTQEVSVLDDQTQKPIEAVQVFFGQLGVLTDSSGRASLALLMEKDSLHFRHISYKPKTLSWAELEAQNFLVRLEENTVDLDEVRIFFNRWAQRKSEVSRHIAFVSENEIRLQQPQTAADLLGLSGEVFIQKSQQGGGSPMLRGFSANRVLLVIDGIRMNNAIYRSGNLHNVISLDPLIMDHAEVLFGPGSVVYGSDALGGVMNFKTKDPQVSTGSAPSHSGNVSLRYSSANQEKNIHLDFSHSKKKWGFLTSLSFSEFGDLKMGRHGQDTYLRNTYVERINGVDVLVPNTDPKVQRFSGYDQLSFLQKIRFKAHDSWEFNYAFHFSRTDDIPRYDRLIEEYKGEPRKAEWFYGPQIWHMHTLSAEYNESTPLHDQLQYTVSFQEYTESRHDRNFQSPFLRSRRERVEIASMSMDARKKLSPSLQVFYGAEAFGNWVSSAGKHQNIETGEVGPISSRYPDGSTWHTLAAYSRLQWDSHPGWTFSGGVRYNHIFYSAPFTQDFFDFPFDRLQDNLGALNGSVGAIFHPDPTWQLHASLSSGFRAANIDDLGKVFDSEPGNVIVPNSNLQPEYAYTLDIGLEKKWKSRTQVSFSTFYTWLDNAIVRQDFTFNGQDSILYDGMLSRVQADVNAESAQIYGVQFNIQLPLGSIFLLKSALTWMQGEDNQGNALRHVSPTFGGTHLIFDQNRFQVDLYTLFNSQVPFERLAPSERNKTFLYVLDADGNPHSPAWYTLNLKATYQFSEHLQGNFGLENITDQRYRPYSSGIAGAGRNWVVGIQGSL